MRSGIAGARAPRNLRLALALNVLLSSVGARAEGNHDAAGAHTLIEWDAPQGCPSADAVYQSLSDARAEAALSAFSHVRGSIRERGGQWVLALEIEDEGRRRTRWIQAHDCADLADAAALAIQLALADGKAAADDTAATPVAPDPPSPRVAAPSAEPDAVDRVESTNEPPQVGLPWRAAIDAGVVMDLDALSALAWGPRVGARARYGRLAAGLAVLWLPPVDVAVGPGQTVQFTLAAGEVSACYRLLEARVAGDLCAGIEVGRFGADGAGLSREERKFGAIWLAPQLGLELSAGLGEEFALVLRGQMLAPLFSESYAVNGAEVVYEPPNLGGRFSLGLSFAPGGE
jgi:hypothetical protein